MTAGLQTESESGGRASARRHFPEAWLLLVGAPALSGRCNRPSRTRRTRCSGRRSSEAPRRASARRRRRCPLAGSRSCPGWGAAVWAVVPVALDPLSWYGGSLQEEESGGLGRNGLRVRHHVRTDVPGALRGNELRRSPLATSAAVLGGAGFLICLLWLMGKLRTSADVPYPPASTFRPSMPR